VEATPEEQEAAARKIQAVARGNADRKKVEELKAQRTAEPAPESPTRGGDGLLDSPTAKKVGVRQYLDGTVVPVLRAGLRALVKQRPDDPFDFLAEFIKSNKPQ